MGAVPFLQLVAEDLTAKYGGELSDLTVVFPNNRARLFFNNYLVKSVDKPIWSPVYMTIQDMFASCTDLRVADDTKLICDLFKAYSAHIDWKELDIEPETMDTFYFWGEVILSDFEDVDNNLVPASMLFKNMVDLARMEDDFSFLSEDQIASLQRFFHNFSVEQKSLLKRKFMALWNALLPMYTDFRENLRAQGLAYGGMLHRIVVDEVLKEKGVEPFPSKKYVFVGFNVLNKCEIELFSRLRKAGKALFYWDTDEFYMNMPGVRHEAATFMLQNLEKFPNELPQSELNVFRNTPKRFSFISSSTENAQAKYLNDFLMKCKENGSSDSDTAVVLCDESLLLPVLHSIPPCVDDLNITMGLPLIQTPIYALMKVLVEMQCSVALGTGNPHSVPFRFIREVLSNPYVQIAFEGATELQRQIVSERRYYLNVAYLKAKSESLDLLFSFVGQKKEDSSLSLLKWLSAILKHVAAYYREEASGERVGSANDSEPAIYDALYREALFRTYTIVNRLMVLSESGDLKVDLQMMGKLLERLLSSVSVPFSGEPVKGMQVMGFLETRNLDFKNVVMLSVNEGILPKGGGESSFIPHSLRRAFGMTTIEHKNSLYAYYFYRLLQRVENATFLYSTATTGGSKGQMSRFLMQLLAETDIEVNMYDLRSDIEVSPKIVTAVAKTDEMIEKLRHKYDKAYNPSASILSPSMLNTYISCQLKFYFSYVMGIKEPEELDDEVDNRLLGLVLHAAMEEIYGRFKDKEVKEEDLRQLLGDDDKLEVFVDNAFRREYFKSEDNAPIQYSGQQLLLKMTVLAFVKNVLSVDLENCVPFEIIGVETKRINHDFVVDGMRFTLGGIIDRLQKEDGASYRVVDYKTKGLENVSKISFTNIPSLFDGSDPKRDKFRQYALQVMLYAYLCTVENGWKSVPSLFFVRHKNGLKNLFMGDGKEKEEITSISSSCCEKIEETLTKVLRKMFDPNEPFVQTSNFDNCGYCPYVEICRGKKNSGKD